MSFLQEYKRLDNMLKDIYENEKGVTSYIDEMTALKKFVGSVPGWNSDYTMLKKYRHIRNRIVHDNDCDEQSLCTQDDILWIMQFHRRILEQKDPIALFYQSQYSVKNPHMQTVSAASNMNSKPQKRDEQESDESDRVTLIIWLIAVVIIFLCILSPFFGF